MTYYNEILEKYKDLSKDQKIIKFFEIVRDITYADVQPRTPESCWKQQKGPCSTKNIILYNLYKAIDVPVQIWMCSFEFKKSKKFTEEMNSLLEGLIVVLHTFIKIEVNNHWIIVDATHDLGMEKVGVPVQKDWDGKTDTLLAVRPIEFFQVNDIDEKKKEFYSKETSEQKETKKKFMKLFFEWIDSFRD